MIDRNIPKRFVSDKDERLLELGDMIEAKNVTISHRGEGSEMILKTMDGTSTVAAASGSELSEAVTVIGQVTDNERGFVYFFVSDNSGNNSDGIYRINLSLNKYEEVFRDSFLNFSGSSFIKSDVINKDFDGDGSLETVLYFTDNDNPPRKINVDRAIAGDYDGKFHDQLDYMLSVVRAAPNFPPQVYFETDSDFYSNNFLKDSFQFSTQLIYNDGEESALSPYSKIAFTRSISYQGVEEDAGLSNNDNVCVVKINYSTDVFSKLHVDDVKKVRLLARAGNSGAFFVVDEFDPSSDLTRNIYGVDTEVFDASRKEYRFYNEGSYQPVSDAVVNKLYDNVPLKAEGQVVSENRLMFSNYNEGRDNTDVDSTIIVRYAAPISSTGGYGDGTGTNTIDETATLSNGDVEVSLVGGDFTWPSPNNATSAIPAGSETRIRFGYDSVGTFYGPATGALNLDAVDSNGDSMIIKFGHSSLYTIPINAVTVDPEINVVVVNSEDTDVAGLADLIQQEFNLGVYASKTYSATFNGQVKSTTGTEYSVNQVVNITTDVTVVYAFDDTDAGTANDGIFKIKPYVRNCFFNNINVGSETYTPTTQTFVDSDEQSDLTYTITNTTAYVTNPNVFSSASQSLRSFKAGSTHELGVVYYDKYNRSGFVNKIGSFFVKPYSERTAGEEGAASIEVSFDSDPPDWATSFQVVYPGMSTYQDFTQYTVGGGYPVKDTSNAHLEDKRRIYVSLKTLDAYKDEKSALRDYSFTPGDKLRVISYDRSTSATQNLVYAAANDGSPVEFDIIGVEVLGATNNPIGGNSVGDEHQGTFLVLDSPAVDSGLQVDTNDDGTVDDDLKYDGFDWFSITSNNYPSGDAGSGENYWGRRCLVELLTPRKTVSEKVYYEIGEAQEVKDWGGKFTNDHGPKLVISDGDVHIRRISCKTPWYDSGWNEADPDDWRYENIAVESKSISDYFDSDDWSRGRAHTVFENASNITRYNSITYSDAYSSDSTLLSLSSFNPSLANFFDLPSEYGSCHYIGRFNDRLLAIQDSKFSLLGVNKNVLETGTQSGLVSLSTNVINNLVPYSGDYGTQNPESVLIRDGVCYAVDVERRAILKVTSQGLKPISKKDIDSFVLDKIETWEGLSGSRIASGYDPDNDVYYVTFSGSVTPASDFTIGYDEKGDFWQGEYTFIPSMYSTARNKMYGYKYYSDTNSNKFIAHEFGKENQTNSFLGADIAESAVTVVSNYNPSMVKQYNSISLEGDTSWSTELESSFGQQTAALSFVEKEDGFYANVTGDTSSNSTSQYIPVGIVDSVSGNEVTMENNLRGIQIPPGYTVFKSLVGIYLTITGSPTVSSVDRSTSTITLSSGSNVSPGDNLFVANTAGITGDQIRGHYCKIKCSLTPTSTQKAELYAINANFVNSKANHALGQ